MDQSGQTSGRRRFRGSRRGLSRRGGETRLQLVERIGEAYGLVLVLVLVTFTVTMTLPPRAGAAASRRWLLPALPRSSRSRARMSARRGYALRWWLRRLGRGNRAGPGHHIGSFAQRRIHRYSILLAIAAGTILRRVIGAIEVDFRTILGAISVFTTARPLVRVPLPGLRPLDATPSSSPASPIARSSDYLFFSYTTLTTTGYGNLVPAGTVGQSFAVLEMLVGQIFLVTLVAGLVSLWRPGSAKDPIDRSDDRDTHSPLARDAANGPREPFMASGSTPRVTSWACLARGRRGSFPIPGEACEPRV